MLHKAEIKERRFLNPIPTTVGGFATVFKVLPRYLTNRKQRSPETPPGPFLTDPKIYSTPGGDLRVTWFGHSSSLIEIEGVRVLIDPVWERRASPFQWSGPKRFFDPTIALSDLPELDAILISHDHYDHLGESTVRTLGSLSNAAHATWVTSKGVGAILANWGVTQSRIVELDWTETSVSTIRGTDLKITSWPARHFSGRTLLNRFETLWASFVIEGDRTCVFYGADSGHWPGFAEIAKMHRAFDLTMLEIGAFDPLWADIHLGPEGAVSAFSAMNKSGLLMPIHWGLFDLALHGWTEPIEELDRLSREHGIALWSPEPGLPSQVLPGVALQSEWWMCPRNESV